MRRLKEIKMVVEQNPLSVTSQMQGIIYVRGG